MVSKAAQAALAQKAAAEKAKTASARASVTNTKYLAHAERKIDVIKKDSQYFDEEDLAVMPKFELDELTLGRILGKGGFGTVKEINMIQCTATAEGNTEAGSPSDGEQEQQDKKFIAEHCIREGGDARYAIKALSPEIKSDSDKFLQGVIDMSVETMFLSVVEHPHIIKMRGLGACGMTHPDYFIVLDRLYDTLEARIPKWKLETKKANSVMNKMKKKSTEKNMEILKTKLGYAYDLMGAIEYLHKKGLIYRDLKPENVGFNVRDDIVLFDFGLAREVLDKDKLTEHTWKMTGETGSLRYMAPEVAKDTPYGYSADVYSFGIMLWEMLKMEKPFAGFNKKSHHDFVVLKGSRPKVDESWSASLSGFLSACWNHDLTKRPSAARASNILKREVAKVSDGGASDLNNFRRKSTFVNRDSLRERRSVMKAAAAASAAVVSKHDDKQSAEQ
jgi:serine/threonine protein kinase